MTNNELLAFIKSYVNIINRLYADLKDDANIHLRKNLNSIEDFGLTYEILKNYAYNLDSEQIEYIEANIASKKEVETDTSLLNELNNISKTSAFKINNMYISFIDIVDILKSNLQNLDKFQTDTKFYEYLQEQEESIKEIKNFIALHCEILKNNFSNYHKYINYTDHKEIIDTKFNISKMTSFSLSTDTKQDFQNSIRLT